MKMFDPAPLVNLPADELITLGDELAAYIRHPAIAAKPELKRHAGDRLASVLAEFDRRWQAITDHDSNRVLSNNMKIIYGIFG